MRFIIPSVMAVFILLTFLFTYVKYGHMARVKSQNTPSRSTVAPLLEAHFPGQRHLHLTFYPRDLPTAVYREPSFLFTAS